MKRIASRFALVVMAALCIPSCASEQPLRGPRADEGQVYLYLSCPQKPAEDITFAISGMSFMNNHGVWIDVALERRIDAARAAWQGFETLLSRSPTNNQILFRVAQACRLMAAVLMESGDAAEAQIFAERSLLLHHSLANHYTGNRRL